MIVRTIKYPVHHCLSWIPSHEESYSGGICRNLNELLEVTARRDLGLTDEEGYFDISIVDGVTGSEYDRWFFLMKFMPKNEAPVMEQ